MECIISGLAASWIQYCISNYCTIALYLLQELSARNVYMLLNLCISLSLCMWASHSLYVSFSSLSVYVLVCLSVTLYVSLYFTVFKCVLVYHCLYVSLPFTVSMCPCLSLSLCVLVFLCLYVSLSFTVSMCPCFSMCACLSLSLCPCLTLFLYVSLTLHTVDQLALPVFAMKLHRKYSLFIPSFSSS